MQGGLKLEGNSAVEGQSVMTETHEEDHVVELTFFSLSLTSVCLHVT